MLTVSVYKKYLSQTRLLSLGTRFLTSPFAPCDYCTVLLSPALSRHLISNTLASRPEYLQSRPHLLSTLLRQHLARALLRLQLPVIHLHLLLLRERQRPRHAHQQHGGRDDPRRGPRLAQTPRGPSLRVAGRGGEAAAGSRGHDVLQCGDAVEQGLVFCFGEVGGDGGCVFGKCVSKSEARGEMEMYLSRCPSRLRPWGRAGRPRRTRPGLLRA